MSNKLRVQYSDAVVDPSTMNLTKNPLLALLLSNYGNDEYFTEETRRFNHYDVPVITQDNTVLTHMDTVTTAIFLGVKKLHVKVTSNLEAKEFLRFTFKGIYFFHLSKEQKKKVIELLQQHLKENDREWQDDLKKLGKHDVNEQMAFILKCGKTTVKEIKKPRSMKTLKKSAPKMIQMPEEISEVRPDVSSSDFQNTCSASKAINSQKGIEQNEGLVYAPDYSQESKNVESLSQPISLNLVANENGLAYTFNYEVLYTAEKQPWLSSVLCNVEGRLAVDDNSLPQSIKEVHECIITTWNVARKL